MNKGRPAYYVKLTNKEREQLLALTQKPTAPQRDVLRAKVALLADEGMPTRTIATQLGVSQHRVCKWRKRAALQSLDGLKERQRPGRPRKITEGERLQVIALACEPHERDGRTTPTLDELVERTLERGVVEKISRSTVQRILVSGDIRPHRIRQWLHSPDPAFREKVNVICDLYRRAPEGAVVLSIDEKTGIQAIERKNLDRPAGPGKIRRQEFEYKRHGTQALIAALDVHSGKVFAQCRDRRTQADLLDFMEEVAKEYPDKTVHVVWDNLNTHRAAKWEDFNKAHGGRFHFHFTPIHASWVNQVELLFGIYSRRCLRNASHTSKDHLKSRTLKFFEERNEAPKPFKWSFRGFHLQTGQPKRKPGRKKDAKSPNRP